MKRIFYYLFITRFALYIFGLLAFIIVMDRLFPITQIFVEQYSRWDSVHYIEIAQHGYTSTGEEQFNIAYFPLYPLLINSLSQFGIHPVIAGLFISNSALFFLIYYFYKLARLDFDFNISEKTVLYLLVFPTAYFLSAVYTESLFLAFAISSFYFARKGKWLHSGFIGFFASLVRITGLVLFIALLVEYLVQKKFRIREIKVDIISLLLIPAGLLIYLGLNFVIFNDWFAFLNIQKEHWYKYLSFPWNGFLSAWQGFLWRSPAEKIMVSFMEIAFAAFGLVLTIFTFKIRLSYGIYSLLLWLFITSTNFWLSIPRYLLTIFPIFLCLGRFGGNRLFSKVYTFVSLLLLGLFTLQFILGRWAF